MVKIVIEDVPKLLYVEMASLEDGNMSGHHDQYRPTNKPGDKPTFLRCSVCGHEWVMWRFGYNCCPACDDVYWANLPPYSQSKKERTDEEHA
jgi:hypothetical protein